MTTKLSQLRLRFRAVYPFSSSEHPAKVRSKTWDDAVVLQHTSLPRQVRGIRWAESISRLRPCMRLRLGDGLASSFLRRPPDYFPPRKLRDSDRPSLMQPRSGGAMSFAGASDEFHRGSMRRVSPGGVELAEPYQYIGARSGWVGGETGSSDAKTIIPNSIVGSI